METAVNYWRARHGEDTELKAELVWAGLEPEEFKNLFPFWETNEDVAELNLLVSILFLQIGVLLILRLFSVL